MTEGVSWNHPGRRFGDVVSGSAYGDPSRSGGHAALPALLRRSHRLPPCLGACPSYRPALGRTGDPLQLKANTGRAISFHPSELPGPAGSVAGGRGGRRGAAPSVPPSAANASSGRAWDASFWLPVRDLSIASKRVGVARDEKLTDGSVKEMGSFCAVPYCLGYRPRAAAGAQGLEGSLARSPPSPVFGFSRFAGSLGVL